MFHKKPREFKIAKMREDSKMTALLSKRPDHTSNRNNRTREFSFISVLFCLVVFVTLAYNIFQFLPSQKSDGKCPYDLIMSRISKSKLKNGLQKINGETYSKRTSEKKNFDQLLFKDNSTIACYQSRERTTCNEYLSDMCSEDKQRKWTHRNLRFDEVARNGQISSWKENKEDEVKHPAIDTVFSIRFALTLYGILVINFANLLLQVVRTRKIRSLFQITSYKTVFSKPLRMTLGLLLCHTAVDCDVTVSTPGSYFQNQAQGRYLQGYVNKSFVVSTIFECQVKCDTFHSICRSLNYIENEDGLNICEINNEAQYCAFPGDFIVRENSFYIEVMQEKDSVESCSTCSHKGRIKETKEIPGFRCLCHEGFYGDRCQHKEVNECLNNPCHSNAMCNDTLEYFTCTCNTGFTGNGLICTDVNECVDSPCHSSATCQNTFGTFVCTCNFGFIGNGLDCSDDLKLLKTWLPEYNSWQLCYRASENGFGASTFHSLCNNKGPTVTVVYVGQYIFGGYSDIPWTSTSAYVTSAKAFLFSIKNKDGLQPFKSPLYQHNQHGIYCGSNYGPTFGGGHDLYISNDANSNTGSYTNLGHTYQPPPGYTYSSQNTKDLLAGSHHFTPTEVEVFYLQ